MFPGEKAGNISAFPRNPEDLGTVPIHPAGHQETRKRFYQRVGGPEADVLLAMGYPRMPGPRSSIRRYRNPRLQSDGGLPTVSGLGSSQNLLVSSTGKRREGLEVTGGTRQAQMV